MPQLTIATTALRCDPDPDVNRVKIAQTVDAIMQAHPQVELILFGEAILGWYAPSAMAAKAETIPGQSSQQFSALAQKYGIYLSYGIFEQRDGLLHNSQVLLNPQGEIQVIHRKWNLKTGEKKAGYQPGPTPVTITDIKGIRTALIICADAAHPQTMQTLWRNHPELILFSLADDRDEKWFVAKANARLYDAWLVSANRYGHEKEYWNGHTVISDPWGTLRATLLDQEGYLVYELKFEPRSAWIQKAARNLWVKPPLLIHVLKNWRIFRSYF